ncbi:MAG TPA: aminoglycoside phosphotransferase family protein [Thermoanaerobaculia bacterium]|nr:aminoglycoside phosphotransferase family protein [Thermoanaerobaculia bacterium]
MSVLEVLGSHGYAPKLEGVTRFPVGRPDREVFPMTAADGSAVLVKVYPGFAGETAFQNMTVLWRSSFGRGRRSPGLPRPIEYVPLPGVDRGALVMEHLEGQTLLELGTLEEHLEPAMRLAADLHRSGIAAPRLRNARKLVLSVRRKVERVRVLAPHFGPDLARVAETLEASRPRDAELVPCHGDFSPRNVLVGIRRHVLIDWDRLQLADPARDVAYFGTWCWAKGLRSGIDDWRILDRAVRTYEGLRPEVKLAPRLDFHVAAALVRIAHGFIELWPAEAHLVPRLTAEALRRLP